MKAVFHGPGCGAWTFIVRDEDRAPVLAHRRFQEARHRYSDFSLAQRFAEIERSNLWGANGSVSGLGSEWTATAAAREGIADIIDRLKIKSVLDAPCGDARWIQPVVADVSYVGLDIVPALIERNIAELGSNDRRRFSVADLTADPPPTADLVVCRDCLVHLSFERIDAATANLRRSGSTWLLTTTFPLLRANQDCEDGDWRALNLEEPPFSWPKPDMLINERCEEGAGSWRDKSLGLWRLDQITCPMV